MKTNIQKAASFILGSNKFIIGSGAGIGKDSGLPDFRGNQGFWNHYPPYKGKFNFYECANPLFLQKQPHLFWGFYGSRLQMYRKAIPHKGFNFLAQLKSKHQKQIFIITSNVDGQFQKAGYKQEQIYQVHGSIHYLQCDSCYQIVQNNFQPKINYDKMSSQNLPYCKKCQTILRPNVLMFNDYNWISQRHDNQHKNYTKYLKSTKKQKDKYCYIQIGAGTAVPTIRNMLQHKFYNKEYYGEDSKFIRINPDKEDTKYMDEKRFVHLEMGALDGISQIFKILE